MVDPHLGLTCEAGGAMLPRAVSDNAESKDAPASVEQQIPIIDGDLALRLGARATRPQPRL